MGGVTPLNSSLEPLETSEPSAGVHISAERYGSPEHDSIAPILPEESSFRHSGWAADRRRVYDALRRCGEPQRRVQAFADCGSAAWGHWCEGEPAVTCNHCRDRLCQPCQVARRARLVEAILVAVAGADSRVRFLTFTLKHNNTSLVAQLDRLYLAFRTLRRTALWKSSVTGGALFLEVKVGDDGLYHPHLHVLAEGVRIEQRDLAAAWHDITGDSFIVHITAINDPLKRAQYVTKYATKPADSTVIRDPGKLDEFLVAIKGRRLYQPFGKWRALLPADTDDEPKRVLVSLGSIYTIRARAVQGDEASRRWWSMAIVKWPHLAVFAVHPTHTNSDPAPP